MNVKTFLAFPGNDDPLLPSGWRWATIGEIARVFAGGAAPQESRYFDSAGPLFIRVSDIGAGKLIRNLMMSKDRLSQLAISTLPLVKAKPGTLLFPKSGAAISTNSRALLATEAYIVSHLMAISPNDDLLSDWLFWWMSQIDMMDLSDNSAYPSLRQPVIERIKIPLPPVLEQKRIVAILNDQMAAIDKARAAAQAQLEAARALQFSYVKEIQLDGKTTSTRLGECLIEATEGIGEDWNKFTVLGATRSGLSLAKERPGKHPERYKFVGEGSIFYNPMRILLGSIALVDNEQDEGITSPDYVVFRTKPGVLHHRWFYHWLRSPFGDKLIRSLARGAVRERMLFKRFSKGLVDLPCWEAQTAASEKIGMVKPVIEHIEAQLCEINSLPAALLRRAFKGEL